MMGKTGVCHTMTEYQFITQRVAQFRSYTGANHNV